MLLNTQNFSARRFALSLSCLAFFNRPIARFVSRAITSASNWPRDVDRESSSSEQSHVSHCCRQRLSEFCVHSHSRNTLTLTKTLYSKQPVSNVSGIAITKSALRTVRTDARYRHSKSVRLYVRLSVRLSVTFRYQMKTA